ncbi:EAL domain-containing protein (putative c-di-GMP-specific phosphodiesterase class I) [Phenylobacterium haematophilum]|uniref:EAL domain-containing protein (Putative c-di-GMP-specific phosphodiesterase class I) n=1 Tax=Phenylobacterium haematophilum TaxID=98513 RepID=A0A839ZZZ7_9CAUL|nr:EAL domain-containing protein [Phenylobacterium haematophilum]MBB3891936.1 EAL domain-containing protein (putative c-di-GMP-specific phosphodiesterase class I) [Phenylobacterium haematophilum]
MSLAPQRLLGFAFASADLLLEMASDGRIALAIGASEALSGSAETDLVGRAWRDFIDPRDRMMVAALLNGLRDGGRGGPIVVGLAGETDGKRAASMTAFKMPGNGGAISCALSRAAPKSSHDLHDKSGFEAATGALIEAARATGEELEMAFLEFGGLETLRDRLGPEAFMALERRLIGGLRAQSHGGSTAASLGSDRFALVRQKGDGVDALVQRLITGVTSDSASGLSANARLMSLQSTASPAQLARAIRYTLDNFIAEGVGDGSSLDLNDMVDRSIKKTLADVGVLGSAVNDKRFRLVFQPVVDLKAGSSLHHYEVLVRFGDSASPYPMIRMAEELDMIEPLDIAVVDETIARLAAEPDLKLAANVSGRTIISPAFIAAVRQMLAKSPNVAGRLLIEITESAAIDDLALADRHLSALRQEGCMICLDDFGAGAASLAYLQQLTLDIVKIDGRYIRELQHGGRESTFIRHLVRMCAELKVRTIAEMVENAAAEDAVRRAGVDFAQGWLYGAPGEIPVQHPAPVAAVAAARRPAARRVGSVDSWG